MSQTISQRTYMILANNLLEKRYDHCNMKGHKKVVNGFCNYCFRHYPQTDEQRISDKNKGLSLLIDSLKKFDLSKEK